MLVRIACDDSTRRTRTATARPEAIGMDGGHHAAVQPFLPFTPGLP